MLHDWTSQVEEDGEELLHSLQLFRGQCGEIVDYGSGTGSGVEQSYGNTFALRLQHDHELANGSLYPGKTVGRHLAFLFDEPFL